MRNLESLTALALALALAAPACKSSDCEKAYDMAKKCAKGDKADKIDKGEFVSFCEKAKADPKQKEEVEADLACMKEDSCEKVEACAKGQRARARAKKITEAAAAGKWKEAFDDCTLIEEYYADETYKAECNKVFASADKITGDDMTRTMYRCKSGEKIKKVAPDFEKACKTIAAGQLAASQKAAVAARDAAKNDIKACLELKDLAAIAGGDAVATAEKTCAEMAVAEDAKKAAAEARVNVAAKKGSVPYGCEAASEKLSKIDTEWSKQTAEDVFKACYVELGPIVFAEKAKDTKYICPMDIKKVADATAKYELGAKFPELAKLTEKLPGKCAK